MTTGCIPFVETPEFDCLDALMSFDAQKPSPNR